MRTRWLAVALILTAIPAYSQSLKAEIEADRALAEGTLHAQAGRWSEATGRFLAALQAQPHALEPTFALAAAYEQLRDHHQAMLWYHRYLALAHEPDESIRADVCARIERLTTAAAGRVRADVAVAAEAIAATRDAIVAAGPPEDGTIEESLRVLVPAEISLAHALSPVAADAAWERHLAAVRRNQSVDQAWLDIAGAPAWAALAGAGAILTDESRPLPERALAAANLARLRAVLHQRLNSLRDAANDAGRGC